MKLVAAALGDDAHLSAGAAPELGGRHAGLHCKLLHGVGDAEVAQSGVDLSIDHADTIQQEDIGLRSRPSHIESTALRSSGGGQRARREQRQIQILAGVEWHALDGVGVHYIAECALVGLQQRRHPCHFDGLRYIANLETELRVRDLIHLDHRVADSALEALGLRH